VGCTGWKRKWGGLGLKADFGPRGWKENENYFLFFLILVQTNSIRIQMISKQVQKLEHPMVQNNAWQHECNKH
jgi:hypothetical protein